MYENHQNAPETSKPDLSNIFSLLGNISQQHIIDQEAANQNELNPDAYVLSEVIKQILPLLNETCELYSDLRQRFVEHRIRQSNFAIQSQVILDVKPDNKPIQNDQIDPNLKKALAMIAARLNQSKIQTQNTEIQNEQTRQTLQEENANYRNEISRLRQALYGGNSSDTDYSTEKASSSQFATHTLDITSQLSKYDFSNSGSSQFNQSPQSFHSRSSQNANMNNELSPQFPSSHSSNHSSLSNVSD